MNAPLTLTREQLASARRAQEFALQQAVVLGIAGALPVDRAVAVLRLLIRFVRVWRGACEARALAVRFCDGPPVIGEAPGCEKELCEASKVQLYYARLLLNESPDAPACIAILGALYDYPPEELMEIFDPGTMRRDARDHLRILRATLRAVRGGAK